MDDIRYLSSRTQMRAAALRVGGSVDHLQTINLKGVAPVYPSAVYSKTANRASTAGPALPPPAAIAELEKMTAELERAERKKRPSGTFRRNQKQKRDRPNSRPTNAPLAVDYTGRVFDQLTILGCCKRMSPARQNIWLARCRCGQQLTKLEKDLKKLGPDSRCACKACLEIAS